jgi:BASS family bile acid:Na+ symporter
MRAVLSQTASISVLVFAVSSMLSIGLAYDVRNIVAPLRGFGGLFRALIANFILVPLWAIAIEHMIPLAPPVALGLFLLGASAGAPFLIKLAQVARTELAICAALLVLLIPATVVLLPLYLPLALAHPSLSGIAHTSTSALSLAVPLLSTTIAPMVVGAIARAATSRAAARLVPIMGKLASLALIVIMITTFLANFHELARLLTTAAIPAALLLVAGAFVIGYLVSNPTRERRNSLGLGTAQRNIAAAMIVATQSFDDPSVLVMVTASSLAGLLLLFPISLLLRRARRRTGPPEEPRRSPLPSVRPQGA